MAPPFSSALPSHALAHQHNDQPTSIRAHAKNRSSKQGSRFVTRPQHGSPTVGRSAGAIRFNLGVRLHPPPPSHAPL
ncbi:hypothetical protein PtA15_16A32 [Puccinia triticina]|uniref:Uncharacterized protein n=1 Tax=Puccinia triticina TaxID=208348 RepID=A0ABY7DB10_9BASI|nr:uncharacterized protein PtA15_16A32 [Puccinia triticina]WAQ92127.1 hypothetical protein PtA15_16A32 [Puccinia triticina]WAR63874.1 hypothetical protein PtB15_16B33 [Puccinia triticina]